MSILKAFTNRLMEFITDIHRVFPNDSELRTGKIFLEGLVRINPKNVIVGWKECVNDVYEEQINKGDLNYFIEKDYNQDLNGSLSKSKILTIIEGFRDKVKNMNDQNKKKSMKYVQNLVKLCNMYHKN